MTKTNPTDLSDAIASITTGQFASALPILHHEYWSDLEARFWNASHPLSDTARAAHTEYQFLVQMIWQRLGAGSARPLSVFRSTLSNPAGLEVSLRILGRMYAGCNLAYSAPPPGFWRTVYSITGYVVSQCRDGNEQQFDFARNLCLQLWLMAWLNPLSLVAGRLPIAVRLVGLLSKSCSYSLAPPTHAGSGLAAADLMDDKPPTPFGRLGAEWNPQLPLYVNAQSAAYAIQELRAASNQQRSGDMYEALLSAGRLAGLTGPEVNDFVKRALREFGQTHSRAIPRIASKGTVVAITGMIDVWTALQDHASHSRSPDSERPTQSPKLEGQVLNHSEGGFLLKFRPSTPSLRAGSLLVMRGNDSEPWTLCAVRWLQDNSRDVMIGVEVLNTFARAVLTVEGKSTSQSPAIAFETEEQHLVYTPLGFGDPKSVIEVGVDTERWVLSAVQQLGEDWEQRLVLDVAG